MHTLGYPLDPREFGGGFIYAMSDTRLSLGFVVGLDYEDPMFDPHVAFQRFKLHPLISRAAPRRTDDSLRREGAAGGGMARAARNVRDGALIVGDAAGFLNSMRLKGIHLAMKTGMLAAETAFEAVTGRRHVRSAAERLRRARFVRSWVAAELRPVRHVHQGFKYGLLRRAGIFGLSATDEGLVDSRSDSERAPGHERMRTARRTSATTRNAEGVEARSSLDFRQADERAFLGTRHEEDQPSHLLVHTEVCHTICGAEAWASLRSILSGRRSTRSCRDEKRRARGFRSTRRTACTARRATSWIPIR